MNKTMSGIISLAVFSLYANNAMAVYTPTSDVATYKTEQISADVYNTALSQNAQAPVFKYTDSTGTTEYYKWIMPDLSVYTNEEGDKLFTLEGSGHNTIDFLVVDANGNVSTDYYYATSAYKTSGAHRNMTGGDVTAVMIRNTSEQSALKGYADNVTGLFFGNELEVNAWDTLENRAGAAIHITKDTGSISGDFIKNSATTPSGTNGLIGYGAAIYNEVSEINSISGNFVKNLSIEGGAIWNGGTINLIEGTFVQNEISDILGVLHSGGAIYNAGTINSIQGDFIANGVTTEPSSNQYSSLGGAIYNSKKGIINSLYGNFIGNHVENAENGGAIWNEGTITISAQDKAPMVFATETDTIYNAGVLNFDSGTIYLQSVYDYTTSPSGTMNVNGADVVFAENATLTQKNINVNSGTLAISASGLKSNITNNTNGTVSLLGGTLDVDITGLGQMSIDGDVVSNRNISQNTTITPNNKLSVLGTNLSADVENNGVLEITGGSLSAQYDITGAGVTNIAGNVSSNRDILQNVSVLDGGNFTINSGQITSGIYGAGTTIIGGNVESLASIDTTTIINNGATLNISASNISDSVTNNGILKLNSGEIINAVTGKGQTYITGNVTNNTNWNGQSIYVENTGHLISNAGKLGSSIKNNGLLTLHDGSLNIGVSGLGTTIIDGIVRAETTRAINNNIQVEQGSVLTANATILNGGYIKNLGTLKLTSGYLSAAVSGSGDTEIIGDVNVASKINQDITINKEASLSISASYIGAYIQNDGALSLNGGILTQNIVGNGQTFISGKVQNNSLIEQDITINSSNGVLTTAFDKLVYDITNNGNLVITSGTIDKYVGGNGTISIAGDITNTAYIDHKIDVYSNGTLTSDANLLRKTINNNGKLYLQSGELSASISGDTGELYIQGDVTTGGTITQNYIEIANGGILNAQATHLGSNITNSGVLNLSDGNLSSSVYGNGITNILSEVTVSKSGLKLNDLLVSDAGTLNLQKHELITQDLTLNGTLLLEINNVSKDSSDYTGGHLIVDGNLTYGDNSKLQVLVGSGLSQRQHTGELELITVNGQTSGSFSEIVANNLYSVEQRNNKYIVSFGPTINDVVEMGGGNNNNKVTANAWDSITNPTGLTKELQYTLNYLLQYDEANYVRGLDNLAPSDSNFVAGTARTINTTMAHQIAKRLSDVRGRNHDDVTFADVRGRSGGDVIFTYLSVWAQGLYNTAEQDGDASFDSNTFSAMAGMDGNITDNLTIGVGYAYNKTDAEANERTIKAKGNNISLYGEYVYDFDRTIDTEKGLDEVYKNKQYLEGMYVNAALSYGTTDYEEESELGNFADYTVSSIGVNANVGLVLTGTKFVPEFGVRYLYINEYDYQDAAGQEIDVEATDILTLVANAKYSTRFDVEMLTSEQNIRTLSLKPFGHIGVTYDILNSDNVANVSIANVQYQILGESIEALGITAGLGLETSFWGFDWQLGYDLEWHSNFMSHTGKIRAKHVF